MKVVIIGAPLAGKSTLAQSFGVPVFCTDTEEQTREKIVGVTYLPPQLNWSAHSQYVAEKWLTMNGDWVIEGVAAVRALRKWAVMHPNTMPCDKIIFLKRKANRTQGQMTMEKGIENIWSEVSLHYKSITEYYEA